MIFYNKGFLKDNNVSSVQELCFEHFGKFKDDYTILFISLKRFSLDLQHDLHYILKTNVGLK